MGRATKEEVELAQEIAAQLFAAGRLRTNTAKAFPKGEYIVERRGGVS